MNGRGMWSDGRGSLPSVVRDRLSRDHKEAGEHGEEILGTGSGMCKGPVVGLCKSCLRTCREDGRR